MTTTDSDVRAELVRAAHTLSRLGFVTAFGHVSARVDDTMVITPAADLGTVVDDDLLAVPLDVDDLPPGVPGEAWVHLAAYRRRPDVAAVVRALPEAAFAAGAITTAIPPLHGQGAWLGRTLPVHQDARLMRSPAIADAVAATLGDAHGVVIRGNGAVTVGARPGHAVARMWLLDRTCRLHVATRTADPVNLTDDEVAGWQATADPMLTRLWEHLSTLDLLERKQNHV